MVNFFTSWFNPASSYRQSTQYRSSHEETILAIFGVALALFTAQILDRRDRHLATLFRFIGGGIGLIWLFNRCFLTSNRSHHHGHHAAEVIPVVVNRSPVYSRSYWFWPSFSSHSSRIHVPVPQIPNHSPRQAHTHYSHVSSKGFPKVYQAAAQSFNPHQKAHTTYSKTATEFPTVHRTPAQPNLKPMYQASTDTQSVRGFPNVKHVPLNLGNQKPLFPAAFK